MRKSDKTIFHKRLLIGQKYYGLEIVKPLNHNAKVWYCIVSLYKEEPIKYTDYGFSPDEGQIVFGDIGIKKTEHMFHLMDHKLHTLKSYVTKHPPMKVYRRNPTTQKTEHGIKYTGLVNQPIKWVDISEFVEDC